MSCRTPFRVYTLSNVFSGITPGAGATYPTVARVASITIPFNGAIVGFQLSSCFAPTFGALNTFAIFIVSGQNAERLQISPNISTLGSQMAIIYLQNTEQQCAGLFFKRTAFPVAAGQPISFYISRGSSADKVVGVAALYFKESA